MAAQGMKSAEQAQLAMMLEVTAFPKPGNVDRCHDYANTRLEHFLASVILVRPAFERAGKTGTKVGEAILDAVSTTNVHSGGNTHFGAFILLVPLIMGKDIPGALQVVRKTSVEDAVNFYQAFGMTQVRMLDSDELDVNDSGAIGKIQARGMTLYQVMEHSVPNDMVAREWVNGFARTRRGADLLKKYGCGRDSIVKTFLHLLKEEPDTFIVKKHGLKVAEKIMEQAKEVCQGRKDLVEFDQECITAGINPGSTADIMIASIYVAMGEGWLWDC
jgi:triphosphoribosyl-dephospho-CoA synthase